MGGGSAADLALRRAVSAVVGFLITELLLLLLTPEFRRGKQFFGTSEAIGNCRGQK